MSRSNELEYQVNKVGGWPNGLARVQTYDLGQDYSRANKLDHI